MLRILSKKGQTGGLVTGLVFGIAALVIAVIIALVITGTLNDANLLESNRDVVTVLNENPAWINTTTYTLATYSTERTGFSITQAINLGSGLVITSGNYSLSSVGVLSNASTVKWDSVSLNYTYTQKSEEELSSSLLTGNFTAGINNVSAKIPTVLLIAAIVLILGILSVLVVVWQKMRLGGGSTI